MAWLAVDKDGTEKMFNHAPRKIPLFPDIWVDNYIPSVECFHIKLPKGSIKKLIGKELTWEDEPVEYK